MSGEVDCYRPETRPGERRNEFRHLAGIAAPTVNQQHGRTLAPAIGREFAAIQIEHELLGRGEYRRLGPVWTGTHRVEEDQPGQFAAEA